MELLKLTSDCKGFVGRGGSPGEVDFAVVFPSPVGELCALLRGKRQRLCLFFAILLTIMSPCSSLSVALSADTQTAAARDCPPRDEILSELARLASGLLSTKLALEHLLSGKESIDMSPDSLLLVSLDDQVAVARRRAELVELVKLPKTPGAEKLGPVLECALSSEEFREPAQKLVESSRAINVLRLEFLELHQDRRNALVEFQRKAGRESDFLTKLRSERSKALRDKVETTVALRVAEHNVLFGSTPGLKEFSGARAVLEKTKLSLIEIQLEKISALEERAKFYMETIARLSEIEAEPTQGASPEKIRKDAHDAVVIWRSVVDRTYRGSFRSLYSLDLPELPDLPEDVRKGMGDTLEVRQYLTSLKEAKQKKDRIWTEIQLILEKEVDLTNKLLLQAGRIRSKLIDELQRRGDSSLTQLSGRYVEDCLRELKIVPSQWLALVYFRTQDIEYNLRRGFLGILELAKEVLLLLVFVSVPAILWLTLRRFMAALQKARTQLIARRNVYPMAETLALAIQQLMPYLPWLVTILAVELAKELITRTVFSELVIVLPYIQIYCAYEIFKLVFGEILAAIAIQAQTATSQNVQSRLGWSTKTVGRFVLFSWFFLYAVESIVSRALIYRLASKVVIVAGILVVACVANKWREELAAVIEESAPSAIGGRLAQGCRGRTSVLWSLPALVVMLIILSYRWIGKWGERFDVYKRLSARVFRRKLEMSVTEKPDSLGTSLPEGYTKWFAGGDPSDLSVQVVPGNDLLPELKNIIETWRNGAIDEQTLAVYGERGSGKSTLLNRLERELSHLRVIRSVVPSKMLRSQELLPYLGGLLGCNLDSAASLVDADRSMPKTVLLLDDAHNLFLAKVGGFEAFRTLIDLVNERTKNLFGCLTFNLHSWGYLDKVFGRYRCVSMVRELTGWSESDVRALILARHAKTGFKLSYQSILKAVGAESEQKRIAQIESNCFRLLWQQSGGTPLLALHLWLSSLSLAAPGLLRVGLPEDVDKGLLGLLSEDALFVYTELIRHGSLSSEEAAETTNLPDSIVKQALKEGIDNRILAQSENGRYEISTAYQPSLINTLMVKNFIYGT